MGSWLAKSCFRSGAQKFNSVAEDWPWKIFNFGRGGWWGEGGLNVGWMTGCMASWMADCIGGGGVETLVTNTIQ